MGAGRASDILESMKVYIVDDASFIRIICRYHLTAAGHEIIGESHDGAIALQEIQSLQPDCVVVDLALPNKNGVEIIKEVQQKFPQIHFVIITALDKDVFDSASGNNVKVSGFLTKPFEGEDLVDRINSIEKQLGRRDHG